MNEIENPQIELPDLAPNTTEAYVTYKFFDVNGGELSYDHPILKFDTHSQNLGQVPVELRAEDSGSVATGSPVSQCVSWTTDLICRQREIVGGFTWHEDHLHYHYEGFGRYELRSVLPTGAVNYSPAGLLAESPKVSFCLIDSVRVRDDGPLAARYYTCNPVEEGISAGWADIYSSDLDGQELSLEGLSDGRYALVIDLNVQHRLMESDYDNNRVVAIYDISNIGQLNPTVTFVDKRDT